MDPSVLEPVPESSGFRILVANAQGLVLGTCRASAERVAWEGRNLRAVRAHLTAAGLVLDRLIAELPKEGSAS